MASGEQPQRGPLYTIVSEDRLPTGAVRVLVRVRGGPLIRVYVPPMLVNGPNIEGFIVAIIELTGADRLPHERT